MELKIQNEKDSVNGNKGKRRFQIRGTGGREGKTRRPKLEGNPIKEGIYTHTHTHTHTHMADSFCSRNWKYVTNFKFRNNREEWAPELECWKT